MFRRRNSNNHKTSNRQEFLNNVFPFFLFLASNAYKELINTQENSNFAEKTRKMTTDSIINNKLEKIANNNNVVTNNCHNGHSLKYDNQVKNEDFENRKSLILLVVIFVSSLIAMIYIYNFFPELDE